MKPLIIILLLIFFIPMVYGELEINPIGYDGTVNINTEKKAEISIKNTFSFSIYNINFTPIEYVTIPIIPQIDPNQTKKINITIKTNDVFNKRTFNSVVKFRYYSSINLDPITYQINITNNGFKPNILNIKIGDIVKFYNNQSVFASIKDDKSPYQYFDKEILPQQTITLNNFNKIDTIDYTDWNIFKKGKIFVEQDSNASINNPDYNKLFTLNLASIYTNSELGIELYPNNNITMEYNEFQELNARIWNKGNNTLHNVTLYVNDQEDWFSFDENNLQLTKNQNRFIKIRITPTINTTEETNKTYSIDIKAESINAETVSTELKIFIPFAEQIQRIYYGEDFWKAREDYCKKYPQDLSCNPPVKVETVKEYIIQNSTIEFSKEEALKNDREQSTRLSGIEGVQEKATKSLNTMESTINNFNLMLDILRKEINESNTISESAKNKAEDMELTIYWLLLLVVIVLVTGTVTFYIKKRLKMKKEIEQI